MDVQDLAQRVEGKFQNRIQVTHSGEELTFYFNPSENSRHYSEFPLGKISPNGEGLIYDSTQYESSRKRSEIKVLKMDHRYRNSVKENPITGRKFHTNYGFSQGSLFKFFGEIFNITKVKNYHFILIDKPQEIK